MPSFSVYGGRDTEDMQEEAKALSTRLVQMTSRSSPLEKILEMICKKS